MLDERTRAEVESRFPEGSLLAVELHSDVPPSTEAGSVLTLMLVPKGPEEYNAAALETTGHGEVPEAVYHAVVEGFREANADRLQALARDLPKLLPECTHLGVRYEGFSSAWDVPSGQRSLTPVLTRLDRTDLETLDTLIAVGFASSRAEAIRWALGRVRERPAYRELRQHIGTLEALKAQF